MTVDLAGCVTVATGAVNSGQGHETTFAQIAADALGVPIESVTVVGSGVTGVEFVHMFSSFGAKVTLVVSRQQVLPGKDPREFKPDLDPAIQRFLIKAIDRNPQERFQTAEAFPGEVLLRPAEMTVSGRRREDRPASGRAL